MGQNSNILWNITPAFSAPRRTRNLETPNNYAARVRWNGTVMLNNIADAPRDGTHILLWTNDKPNSEGEPDLNTETDTEKSTSRGAVAWSDELDAKGPTCGLPAKRPSATTGSAAGDKEMK